MPPECEPQLEPEEPGPNRIFPGFDYPAVRSVTAEEAEISIRANLRMEAEQDAMADIRAAMSESPLSAGFTNFVREKLYGESASERVGRVELSANIATFGTALLGVAAEKQQYEMLSQTPHGPLAAAKIENAGAASAPKGPTSLGSSGVVASPTPPSEPAPAAAVKVPTPSPESAPAEVGGGKLMVPGKASRGTEGNLIPVHELFRFDVVTKGRYIPKSVAAKIDAIMKSFFPGIKRGRVPGTYQIAHDPGTPFMGVL
jgi:hypothetical protein